MSKKDYLESSVTGSSIQKIQEQEKEIERLNNIISYYEEVLMTAGMNSYLREDHPHYFNSYTNEKPNLKQMAKPL